MEYNVLVQFYSLKKMFKGAFTVLKMVFIASCSVDGFSISKLVIRQV